MVLAVLAAQASARTATLEVKSPAFANNGAIPTEFTCDGADVSPPLSWSNVPAGTKTVAILVEDPDAPMGTFTHWLMTGISPTTTSLPKATSLPEGAVAAKNGKGAFGYAGPCPPSGRHRYLFRVFALDMTPEATPTRADFLKAINGHVLATGLLVGTYQRK